jgi:hypothetical protein
VTLPGPNRCLWCRGSLPRDRVAVCEICASAGEPHEWEKLPRTVFVAPLDRDLLTRHGTLGQDPKYGSSVPRPKNSDDKRRHGGITYSGTSQREELARWLASCGLTAEKIADHFSIESLGRRRRSVTVATVRRWAGHELRQYKAQLHAVLASHPLVSDVRNLRVADVPSIMQRIAALRDEYRRSRAPWYRIVLEECDRQLERVRVKSCEHCGESFVAKRIDARYCPTPRCRKAASRRNVTDNRRPVNTPSLSREAMEAIAEINTRMDAQDQTLYQILQMLAGIAEVLFTNRVPASVFGDAIDTLLLQAQLEKAA